MFICSECQTEVDEEREGRSLRCKDCRNRWSRKYWASDRGIETAKRKRAKRFGTTVEYLDALYEMQGGLCASCVQPFVLPRTHKWPCVDHDHRCCNWLATQQTPICGKCIRGLLCWGCNVMLGNAQDDVKRLLNAAAYLERWQALRPIRKACERQRPKLRIISGSPQTAPCR